MSARAGSIVVDLLARTGSFTTDIDRSTRAAEKRFKAMKASAAEWGAAIGATFAGVGLAAAYASKQLIDGMDALNDVADATGSSIENLSALEDIAVRAGGSMDTVTTALLKFNDVLSSADGKNEVSQALQAIGLDVEELKKLDPAEALLVVSKAFAGFADDQHKARVQQMLFGKSTREVSSLLKDLADKGVLVATVTAQQAQEAETFNKQLAELAKNAQDLGRSMVSDLVTGINAAAKALKESGLIEGFRTLFTGDDQHKNNKRLVELTNDLLQAENELLAARAKDAEFGDKSLRTDRAEKRVAKLKAELATVQSMQKLLAGGPAVTGIPEPAARPSVVPPRASGSKGPDPDADFKAYLNNLQQQVQRTHELGVAEKLLDDIRRGSLTVSDSQKQQLLTLAQTIDTTKEAARVAEDRAARRREDDAAALEAARDIEESERRRLRALLDGGPAAQLEKQRKEMEFLADAFQRGAITAEEFNDAAIGYLNLTGEKIEETKSLTEQLGLTFASAFEDAILGGGKLSDVLKGLLQDVIRLVLRLMVVEPLLKRIKDQLGGRGGGFSFGGFGSGMQASFSNTSLGSSGFGTGLAYGNMDFGGFFADGGSPPVGKVSVVGERGPELFVPRTAGMVVPNHALGSGGSGVTIINQTTGRVDEAREVQLSARQRAILISETRAAIARDWGDANSEMSVAFRGNFRAERIR